MATRKLHPYIYIIITFICVILVGTIALALPISSSTGKSFGLVDSLFMATSAVCVTGLSVMENGLSADMSVFGKIVMVLLMEIGGLSFITIAVFFFTIIGAKIGVSNRYLLRESLNQNSVNGILSLVRRIIFISFVIQLIGTIINWYPIYEYSEYLYPNDSFNILRSLGISIFHSAASFNNAGFDIFGNNSMENFASTTSFISKSSILIINSTTMLLIIFGGIGFVVLDDVMKHKRWKKLNLHSKITIIITLLLILSGAILIKLTSNMGWLEAFFSSITSRTAGFATYDMSKLVNYPATYIIIVLLMIVGASPCSTGGGIKTTTFAVIVLTIFYFSRGKKTKAFHRRIRDDQIFKAFVLVTIVVLIIFVGAFLVSTIQPELGIEKIVFEVVSAFSTTGLSMGITTQLNSLNRLILCVLMLFGRLGPLTVIGVVNKNWMTDTKEQIQYIEESVIIG